MLIRKVNTAFGINANFFLKENELYEISATTGVVLIRPLSGNLNNSHRISVAKLGKLSLGQHICNAAAITPSTTLYLHKVDNALYCTTTTQLDISGYHFEALPPATILPQDIPDKFYEEAQNAKVLMKFCSGRGISTPFEISKMLNISGNSSIQITLIKQDHITWLEVRGIANTEPAMSALDVKSRFGFPATNLLNGLTIERKKLINPVTKTVPLPYPFWSQFPNARVLPIWYSEVRNAVIIEGLPSICSVCGKTLRTTDRLPCHTMSACSDCHDALFEGRKSNSAAKNKKNKNS